MVSISIDITQGASLWEPDGADHVKPKGSKKINVAYLELDSKVDKVDGKELSDNNYTDAEVLLVAEIPNKVDKVTGKGLSTEDYTTTEKEKLLGIEDNANNYAHPSNHDPSIITQDSDNRFVSDTQINTWNGKQDAIGFTPENVANKKTTLADNSDTFYPSQKAVKTAVDAKANVTQENWTDLTLINSWEAFSTGLATAGYFKDSLGLVHMRGIIKNGVSGLIGIMPVSYRPEKNSYLASVSDGAFCYIVIGSDGAVVANGYSAGWVSLENITFRAV